MKRRSPNHSFHFEQPKRQFSGKLSLGMIVKDEAQNLAPCINSVKEVVDEIIVVDTGSADNTKEIARQLGARVFDFPWRDDFSAARNESIRHATGDYILWLDADDRVDHTEMNKLRLLKGTLDPRKKKAYNLVLNSQSPIDGETLFHQLRVFPNIPGVIFEGRVHEQIFHILGNLGIQIVSTDIVIRHIGYPDALTSAKKSNRNLAILQKELEEDPDNLLLHYNIARTLSGISLYHQAIPHLERIARDKNGKKKYWQFFFAAALLAGKCYASVERHEEAVAVYKDLSKDHPDNGLVYYCLGQALFLAKEYRGAQQSLEKSLSLPIDVSFFPTNLDGVRYHQYYTLGKCHIEAGRPELGREMLLKSLQIPFGHQKSLEALGLLSLKDQRFEEAIGYYKKALQEGKPSDQVYSNLGLAYWKLNLLAEAEENLLRALEINPRRVEPLANLGHLYYRKKEYLKAINYFTNALDLIPHLIDVRLCLSKIYFLLLELDRLVAQCDALLAELNLPRDLILNDLKELSSLYRMAGETLKKQGRNELAVIAYQVSFMISPSKETLEKIASMASALGILKSCLAEIKETLPLVPPAPSAASQPEKN